MNCDIVRCGAIGPEQPNLCSVAGKCDEKWSIVGTYVLRLNSSESPRQRCKNCGPLTALHTAAIFHLTVKKGSVQSPQQTVAE